MAPLAAWSRLNLHVSLLLVCALVVSPICVAQQGKRYPDGHGGRVYFPLGDLSFADEVVRFETGRPQAKEAVLRNPSKALGIPNHVAGSSNFTTLGCLGTLVLRFVDNVLIDRPGPDLYVFEIGPAVEPTELAISRDGNNWVELGLISGGRADVDIGPFIDSPGPYQFVRLVDGGSDCGGASPGADIDAVGAIGADRAILTRGAG